MIDVLIEFNNKIWRIVALPTPWTQSLDITFPTKGQLIALQEQLNYQPHQSFEAKSN